MAKNLFDLGGRGALVTGGSRGLGKEMARAFAENGANVMITSRHEEELRAAAAEIAKSAKGKVEWLVNDLTQPKQAQDLATAAIERLGKVDILVNNAGTYLP